MTAKRFALGAGLVGMVVAAYLPATRGGFIWDDDDYVTNNPTLRSREGLRAIWFRPGATPQYYPLVFTGFWMEYRLWGLSPAGYHWVNVLLHAANAVLVWRLLGRLKVPGAWLAAAVFALHPVQVESVGWITERKNVLSALLYLTALLAYFRFSPPEAERAPEPGRWGWYALALALFLGALWSKTVTCILPAAVLLIFWWKRGRVGWRDALALVPFFLLGAALALTTVRMEKEHVGAEGAEWDLSAAQRCLIAGRAPWFYAGKLLWPAELAFNYPRWHVDPGAAWQYAFPVAALVTAAVLWLTRSRIGRGPLTAVLFFAGTLTPALGFFNVYPMRYSFVADHFQYLASLGLIALAAALVVTGLQRLGPLKTWALPAAGGAGLVLLGLLTWRQAHAYRDWKAPWEDTLAKYPDSYIANYNLGTYYLAGGREKDLAEAVRYLEAAVAVRPTSVEAHSNLGVAYKEQGRVEEARREFHEALRLDARHAETHLHLGALLAEHDRPDRAAAHFTAALEARPDFPAAHYALGKLLAREGRLPAAVEHLRTALRLDPRYAEAYSELGGVYLRQEKLDDALACFREAVDLRPDEARYHLNLALALRRKGQPMEAEMHFREAVRLEPSLASGR